MPDAKKRFWDRDTSTASAGSRPRGGGAVSRDALPGPVGPQKVVAILNPSKTGYTDAKAHLIVACTDAGWPLPVFLDTTIADPGQGQARAALAQGADVVVAGGGDGTMRAVAETLVAEGASVPLGIVPLGTGNLLARNLGFSVSTTNGVIRRNVRTALHGWHRRIDTIRLTLDEGEPQFSLIFSGIGFDAATIEATKSDLKKRLGPLGWMAYAEAGVRQLWHSRERIPVTITCDDGDPESFEVVSVMVGNGSSIPAGIEFVPGAVLDDGILDVIVVAPAHLHEWAHVATKVITRHRWDVSQLQYRQCKRVEIRSLKPVAAELDGDPMGTASTVVAEILPGSLVVRAFASA